MGKRERKSGGQARRKQERRGDRKEPRDRSGNPEGNREYPDYDSSAWRRERPGYRPGEHWLSEGEYSGMGSFGPAFSPGWSRSFPPSERRRGAGADDWRADQGPHAGRGPRGYQRSDDRLHEEVCERLTEHGALDARNIEVHCAQGEVTLEGTVQDRYSKRLAEEIAESARGVRDVHNRLRVEPHQDPPLARFESPAW